MHYIITDIHNDNRRFTELLQKINLTEKDHLYLLGDLFDRCEDHADCGCILPDAEAGRTMHGNSWKPRSLAGQLYFPVL